VPVQLALVRAEATPDRVVLLWQGPGAGALQAQVQRRTDVAEWQPVGEAVSEGSDRLRFEDVSVEAGSRYAYRLAYEEAGIEHTSVETWVEVPAAFDLALHGFRPNPARGGAVAVAFTLPDNAPASVEVMDVAGRRVARRDVGALGAGRHLMRLTDARLAPGVYLIRLVHGGSDTVARGVVTR
jgi:hypothetical protein